MANISIARRYARALIDVAHEARKLDRIGEQLSTFVRTLEQNRDLNDVMVNPAYNRAQRGAVAEAVMKAYGGFEPELANFLRLIIDRNRTLFLPDIARIYVDLADARAGRVRGSVTSAVPLPADAVAKIAGILESLTQRKVVLQPKVDPSILGGVSTQVGSMVYDGSLRTQLEELRRQLETR